MTTKYVHLNTTLHMIFYTYELLISCNMCVLYVKHYNVKQINRYKDNNYKLFCIYDINWKKRLSCQM